MHARESYNFVLDKNNETNFNSETYITLLFLWKKSKTKVNVFKVIYSCYIVPSILSDRLTEKYKGAVSYAHLA